MRAAVTMAFLCCLVLSTAVALRSNCAWAMLGLYTNMQQLCTVVACCVSLGLRCNVSRVPHLASAVYGC